MRGFLLSFIRLSYHNPKRIDNLSCFCACSWVVWVSHGFTAHIKRLPYWSFCPSACLWLSLTRPSFVAIHSTSTFKPLSLSCPFCLCVLCRVGCFMRFCSRNRHGSAYRVNAAYLLAIFFGYVFRFGCLRFGSA